MRRKTLFFLGALVVVAAALWITLSEKKRADGIMMKPGVSVAAVSIKDIDEDTIKMSTKVVLKNPLPVELTSSNLRYNIAINGTKVIETDFNKPIRIKSHDSSSIEVPMKIPVQKTVSVFKEIDRKNADSAEYTLNAWLELDLPVAGERTFHFDHTMKLPAFQMPKMVAGDIDIEKLRWKESTVAMDMTIINPNVFPIKMKDMKYNVVLGDEMPMEGFIKGITVVSPKSKRTVPVLLKMKNKEVGELMWKALFDSDDTPFAINATFEAVSEIDMLAESKIAMRTSGTMKELKKMAKKSMK